MPTFRGKPACSCLVAWLPVYEAELLRRGLIKHSIDIYQLNGNAKQSAGTHKGGAADLAQTSTEAVQVAREMGAAAWHRTPDQGFIHHTHLVLKGCPHLAPIAANQVSALAAGYNGLGRLGRGGKDDGPAPRKLRTFQEGIAWAKAQKPKSMKGHATLLKRAIQHDSHYARGNSPHGDRVAAKGHLWADRDLQRTIGGRFINTHWPSPKNEGFRTPAGRIPTRPFRLLRWATIKTLRTQGNYRIRTATQALRDAKAAGIPGVELELKFLPTQAALNRLAHAAEEVFGDDWAERVEIKMLTQFAWRRGLNRAKKAGFTTTLIGFSGDPERLPAYVDHYRR